MFPGGGITFFTGLRYANAFQTLHLQYNITSSFFLLH